MLAPRKAVAKTLQFSVNFLYTGFHRPCNNISVKCNMRMRNKNNMATPKAGIHAESSQPRPPVTTSPVMAVTGNGNRTVTLQVLNSRVNTSSFSGSAVTPSLISSARATALAGVSYIPGYIS